MSRREDRESDSRRRRSRFDREPSPKRSRREGKPEAERVVSNSNAAHGEQDGKHWRPAVGVSSHEAPARAEPKADIVDGSKDSQKKTYGNSDDRRHSSNPTEVPRSRSYFQHDERGSAGQGSRNSGRRATTERGWWKDSRDRGTERATNKIETLDTKPREGNSRKGDDSSVWRHDGYFEMEANAAPPPTRKRPAFREQKIPSDAQNVGVTTEAIKPINTDNPVLDGERREERGRYTHRLERSERSSLRDGGRTYRRDEQGGRFISRERYSVGGGGRFRGRVDSFNGRQPFHSGGGRVEKWKHDLFVEANKSPSPKKDDDRLARIEALLAS